MDRGFGSVSRLEGRGRTCLRIGLVVDLVAFISELRDEPAPARSYLRACMVRLS